MRKKFISIFLFIILLILPSISFATVDNGYAITSYDININVNENNTFDITETIVADFSAENKHGIVRTIPLLNDFRSSTAQEVKNKVQINNISVNTTYIESSTDTNLSLQIGDPNKTVKGPQTYIIKYTYDMGEDLIYGSDEFYFNLTGKGLDTTLNNVSFTINMPKDFEETEVEISPGAYDSIEDSNIIYNIEGTTITGYCNQILQPYDKISARIVLPDGYFVGARNNNMDYYIIIAVSIGFVLFAFVLWFFFGRNKRINVDMEFLPPDDLNSAEIGFLYKGKATDKTVLSLLIYLAEHGYLSIDKFKNKYGITDFKITKLKDYTGKNKYERKFFKGLFKKKTSVTSGDLYKKFYITIDAIKSDFNKKENKYKVIDKKSVIAKILLIPLIFIVFLLITIKPFYDIGETKEIIYILAMFVIFASMILYACFNRINNWIRVFYVFIFLVLVTPYFEKVGNIIFAKPITGITFLIGLACILLLVLFYKIMLKRTEYGNKMFARIKAFRHFLKTTETQQLEMFVESTPEYFYNILPYTYALGISDKWIKQFEKLGVDPSEVDDPNYNSQYLMSDFMGSTMHSISSSMTSSPTFHGSSSGGNDSSFSSGGGSSGGGAGGGSISSW